MTPAQFITLDQLANQFSGGGCWRVRLPEIIEAFATLWRARQVDNLSWVRVQSSPRPTLGHSTLIQTNTALKGRFDGRPEAALHTASRPTRV